MSTLSTTESHERLRARALRLLDYRDRSRCELRQRLVDGAGRDGEDPEGLDELLDAFERVGLIDDARFAREWVRQRHHSRGLSRSALDRELRDKGINADNRAAALAQIHDADERARALAVAGRHCRSIDALPEGPQEKSRQLRRVLGALARRGFPEGLSHQVAREALSHRLEELSEV